jgi:hypothetical protein
MAELKTKPTNRSVAGFLKSIKDAARRKDCQTVLGIMRRATGAPPRMWGPSIVGFGEYEYRYESGRALAWFLTGFSPRKQNLTLYIMPGFQRYPDLMAKLGKHSTGKSCLYLKRLDDVDLKVLSQLVKESVAHMKRR